MATKQWKAVLEFSGNIKFRDVANLLFAKLNPRMVQIRCRFSNDIEDVAPWIFEAFLKDGSRVTVYMIDKDSNPNQKRFIVIGNQRGVTRSCDELKKRFANYVVVGHPHIINRDYWTIEVEEMSRVETSFKPGWFKERIADEVSLGCNRIGGKKS